MSKKNNETTANNSTSVLNDKVNYLPTGSKIWTEEEAWDKFSPYFSQYNLMTALEYLCGDISENICAIAEHKGDLIIMLNDADTITIPNPIKMPW